MKIGTQAPSLAIFHNLESPAPQAPIAARPEPAQATPEIPLDLAIRPRARGIHPFLAMTLGDKGCASSSGVSLEDDAHTQANLNDFSVASRDVNHNNICAGLSTECL